MEIKSCPIKVVDFTCIVLVFSFFQVLTWRTGTSPIFDGVNHHKSFVNGSLSFSIAMLNNQRVYII